MENTNTILILNEVRGISPVVADIGNKHPYSIPPAYFENLAVELLLRIAIEEKKGADPVLNINKDNQYHVPQGYFEGLAGDIMKRVKAQEAGNPKEELELLSPLLGQIGKKNPFTPPDDYFSEFSDNMVAGVKAIEFVNEELENLSPTMNSLRNKQVYEVPQGYFENNIETILTKARQQPAKIVSIGFGRKIMRYAAAAVVTGVIILAGYMYSGTIKPLAGGNNAEPELAKVTDLEIENFLNNNTASVADTSSIITADDDINDKDSKDLLANISDEELQQYAEQHLETPVTN